ncbi:rod shape-determining protein RodA [Bacillus sp. CGMCC 1.16541]|uniref:rod shape-determining protein RodA n=1 Tax=Bacillus sp. CGMCC 1.16541 TaxID=2185143 RepID=UPI000D725F5C|nr:rod shape-determining protein RodA [Bacillus sp. CGMCC 1.16541]
MKPTQRHSFTVDSVLLFMLLLLFIYSLLAVYSGSGQYQVQDPYFYVKRQFAWYVIGGILMYVVMKFDYELLPNLAWPLYGIGLFLLILVHFFGTYKNGSQRWINLGGFLLQPSEFMKIFLIILLATILSKLSKHRATRFSFKQSISIVLLVGVVSIVPFFLILQQPDLGTALVIGSIALTLILVSGISMKMIGLIVASIVAGIGFLVFLHNHYFDVFSKIIKSHQLDRIYGWLNPHEHASNYGYQLTQSLLGIGSGQVKGTGFTNGIQVQSGRIPEAHTDFIFAVIGEEFGFVGAAVLLAIYFIMLYRMVVIAFEANTLFATYLVAGVIGLLTFQIYQNIAMTIGLMPVTGLALPLISYGGSALLTNMMAIGIVLGVSMRTKLYMFGNEQKMS